MALWLFEAQYDPEARVWWTFHEQLSIGTEAETLEQLAARLEAVLPELIELGEDLTDEQRRGPHDLRLIAHHEMHRQAAA